MLQWIKKHLPTRQSLKNEGYFSYLGKGIYNPRLWGGNRESISRGLAIGVFVAILPLPLQSLLALAGALLLKGNLPIALAATWISNPITFVPICLLVVYVGQLFIGGQNDTISIPNFNWVDTKSWHFNH